MQKVPNTFVNRINRLDYSFFRSRSQAIAALFGGSVCVASGVLLPNFAFEWTKYFLQAERKGTAVAPAQKLQTLLETAKSDLKLSQSESAAVNIFSIDYDTCEVFGSLKSRFGSLLGIPEFLNAESPKEVTLDEKLLSISSKAYNNQEDNNVMVKTQIKAIEKFKESSTLSDAAKLYVIGEGLTISKEHHHYIAPTIVSSAAFAFTFIQSSLIVRYTQFKSYPFVQKTPVYVISAVLWLSVAVILIDVAKVLNYENAISCLSERYIDGGIEYYEKLKIRNETRNKLVPGALHTVFDKWYVSLFCDQRLARLRKRKEQLTLGC